MKDCEIRQPGIKAGQGWNKAQQPKVKGDGALLGSSRKVNVKAVQKSGERCQAT